MLGALAAYGAVTGCSTSASDDDDGARGDASSAAKDGAGATATAEGGNTASDAGGAVADGSSPVDGAAANDAGDASAAPCIGPSCIPPGAQMGDIDITSAPYDCTTTAADNTACINKALTAGNIYVPPGTFAHTGCLEDSGHRIDGAGYAKSILKATGTSCLDIVLTGAGASVSNVQLTTTFPAERQNDSTKFSAITPQGTGWQVDHVLVDGNFTAGIFSYGGSSGKITNSTIENTKADCIGFYHGSTGNLADSNYIFQCGDDGISNVTYTGEPLVGHNTIQNNVVEANLWGRNFTAVGCEDVTFTNNYARGNKVNISCLYFGADKAAGSNGTPGSTTIAWSHGTLDGTSDSGSCGYPSGPGGSGYAAAFVMYGFASNTSSATFDSSYVTNPGHADIDLYDDLETLSLTDYVCAEKGGVSLSSGHVPVNTACSTGCASVGYSPTPVGVDGKLHPPPTPPATP